jgi:hypothetical protein
MFTAVHVGCRQTVVNRANRRPGLRTLSALSVAAGIAAGALMLTILVHAAYVAPLLAALRVQAGRGGRIRPHITNV